MRRLLQSRWLRALLAWTAFIAVPVVLLWPTATAPFPPCNYQGAGNPDPTVPTCPPDNANYDAIGVSLLTLLWLAGISVGLMAFAISWFRSRGKTHSSMPRDPPIRR